jgi:hypothetical protein
MDRATFALTQSHKGGVQHHVGKLREALSDIENGQPRGRLPPV